MLQTLRRDLAYSLRTIRRCPGLTATIVLTLALGIGSTTAVFTVVNGVLLRPLPYPESNRLVYVSIGRRSQPVTSYAYTRYYPAWRDHTRTLSAIAGYFSLQATFAGKDQPERVACGLATESLLPLLGAQPVLGRNFLPEEDRPGGPAVAILDHAFWKRRFDTDPAVIGKSIVLDDRSYTVIGVLPPNFQVPDRYGRGLNDVWVPFALGDNGKSAQALLCVIARLKPGLAIESARDELNSLLKAQLPKGVERIAGVVPWHDQVSGGASRSLILFLVAVAFVLLIACVNVANLLLSRTAAREKEIAVRRALGAGRGRIIRQLLTENVVLALLGGTLGLVMAYGLNDLLLLLIRSKLPSLAPIQIDRQVLLFDMALALLTGVAFGLAPAVQASGVALNETLKDSGRGVTQGRAGRRFRSALAVVEVALAMVLLCGAGLLVKSFLRLRVVNLGFQTDRVLAFDVSLSAARYPKRADQSRFLEEALHRIEGLPGVRSVSGGECLPLTGSSFVTDLEIEGRTGATFNVSGVFISPGYFQTMSIPLLRGRPFTAADREGAPGVTLVNQSFVRRYLPDGDLGTRISDPNHKHAWLTIVGVVGDVRPYPEANPEPEIYLSYLQHGEPDISRTGSSFFTLVLRGSGDPMRLVPALRGQIAAIDRNLPLQHIETLEERRAQSIAPRRVNMILIGAFAALALALGAIGVYGVLAWSVSRRTNEIGVRLALGAHPRQILRMVLRDGMRLIAAGAAIGALASLALTRLIANELWGVSATDPWTFFAVASVLAVTG
ncbi:MAG TPA: ABC transporter permease, partial [Bryobacteraceae bacterium]